MKYFSWAIITMLLFSIAGCTNIKGSVPAEAEENNGDHLTTVKVIAESPGAVQFMKMKEKEIAEKFGIKLVYNYPQRLTENLEDFLFATKEKYDIYSIFPVKLPLYVERDMLLPLENYMTDEFTSDLIPFYKKNYMEFDGHTYGMAYDGDAHLLFYRKDIFEKYNDEYKQKYGIDLTPPKTWEEYDQIAHFLTRDENKDGKIDYYGTALLNGGGMTYIWFVERFLSMGGQYFDENMNPTINSEIGVKALQSLVDLQNSDAVPPGSMYDWVDLNNAFLQGYLGMTIQWSDTARFSYDPNTWDSKVSNLVDWSVVPGGISGAPTGGAWIGRVLAISKNSEIKDKAWQVIEYLTSKDVSIESINSYKTINDPYRYSHLEVNNKGPFPSVKVSNHFFSTLEESLKNINPELMIPGSWDYMQSIDRNIQLALIGKLTAEEALDQTAAEWNEITEKYGRDSQKEYYQKWLQSKEDVLHKTSIKK
ncbi:ABC transporter substrate-binding protein [Schinkia sp. CFF1]